MAREKSQLDKFKEAAREAECDTSEEKFDKVLGKLAKVKPPPKPEKPEDDEPAD